MYYNIIRNNETLINSYSIEDIYAVYVSEKNDNNSEYYLTLHMDKNFEYNYNSRAFKGTYEIISNKVQLNYTSENSNGLTRNINDTAIIDIVDKTKLYDNDNGIYLNRSNIPTNPGECC